MLAKTKWTIGPYPSRSTVSLLVFLEVAIKKIKKVSKYGQLGRVMQTLQYLVLHNDDDSTVHPFPLHVL